MLESERQPDPDETADLERGRLERALELSATATWHLPSGATRLAASAGMEALVGPAPRGGFSLETFIDLATGEERAALAHAIEQALEEGVAGEVTVAIEREECTRFVQIRVEPGDDGLFAVLRDVGPELEERDRARIAGAVDALTGLPNRRQFQSALGDSVARAVRAGKALAVMHVEIDDFSGVVRAFGSALGDEVLRAVAQRLRGVLRSSDTVARGARPIARIGGAGFLVSLPDLGRRFEPAMAAERLLSELRRPYPVGEAELTVTTSIGLAVLPDAGVDPLDLMRHAEVALAHARRLGGDRLEVFRDGLERDAEGRLQKATELFRGIQSGQLELVYQPVFQPVSRTCQGVEALVRWRHPTRGLLPPDAFLDVAEDTGIIVPLGEWVLEEACAQWRQWLDLGFGPVEIAVNLSGRQLRDPKLVARVHRVLADSGMDPVFLRLEVPEDVLTPPGDGARRALGRLRRLGVGLTLDDFGTRSSSLAKLRELDVDLLKIGRDFVAPLPADQEHAGLVAGIVALAHKLRFRVVAEGVETDEQLRYLRALDCEGVQGFLLGAPGPPAAIEEFLVGRSGAGAPRKVIPFRRRAIS